MIGPRAISLTGARLRTFQTEADVAGVVSSGSKQHVIDENSAVDQRPQRVTPDCCC